MIGIPPTILGVLFVPIYLTLLSLPIFFVALALFVGGYVLQFAGHFSKEPTQARSSTSNASLACRTSSFRRHRRRQSGLRP